MVLEFGRLKTMASGRKNFDLRTVCNALATMKTKWFEIGLQLGVPHNKLLEFKEERDPLSAVVDFWLKGNVDSVDPISWRSIVAVLKSEYVSESGLAEQINNKFCFSESSRTVEETKDKAASELSLLTPEVEMDLRFILERNLKEIIKKYAAYVDCAVEKKEVSPIELRFYLLSISAFCSGSCNGQRFALVSDEHELKSCATITDIFAFLTTKCASFLNYDIFQDIIKKYDIATDRSELNYPQYVNEYIEKHKVSEFMKINPLLKPKNGSETLTLKYDVDYTCKLAKISELKNSLAEILDLHPSALHIIDIEEGCIVVTFHILASVAKAIFVHERVFTSQQKNAFHAASVLWLKCNGYTFNFKESDKKEVNESQALKKRKRMLITCSVCHGTYVNPKLLQCHHSFCQQCLERLVRDMQGRSTITCPLCCQLTAVPVTGVAGLQSDFTINELIEILGQDWQEVPELAASLTQPKAEKKTFVMNEKEALALLYPKVSEVSNRIEAVSLMADPLKKHASTDDHGAAFTEDIVFKSEHKAKEWTNCGEKQQNFAESSIPKLTIEQILAGEELRVNKKVEILVSLTSPCRQEDVIECSMKSLVSGMVCKCVINFLEENRLSIYYTPTMRGCHELLVTVNDQEAKYSMFASIDPVELGKPVAVIGDLISGPFDVTVSSAGEILVATAEGLLAFDKKGKMLKNSGQLGMDTCFYSVAVDNDGDSIYATITTSHTFDVIKLNSNLELMKKCEVQKFPKHYLSGLAVVGDEVMVCDYRMDRIMVYTKELCLKRVVSAPDGIIRQFKYIRGLSSDKHNNLYVSEEDTCTIKVFSPKGKFLRLFGNGKVRGKEILSCPVSLSVSGRFIYISDHYFNDYIAVFTTEGEFVTSFGCKGSEEGKFCYVWGVHADKDGFIYVCDRGNRRVQIF